MRATITILFVGLMLISVWNLGFKVVSAQQMGSSSATVAPGSQVSIHGSGFLPTDNTCTLSSRSSPNLIFEGSAACVIQVGSGIPLGAFTVGNAPPGGYVIQVTGNPGGDFAEALIIVA